MKLLNLCLSSSYKEGMGYQDNLLTRSFKNLDITVLIIASTEIIESNNKIAYTGYKKTINEDGIEVIRLPYTKIINNFISRKVRKYDNLYYEITRFNPDIIMFHGISAYALKTVTGYVKKHPGTAFIADSHICFYNSSRTFISKNILHRMFYKPIYKKALKYLKKVYAIGYLEYQYTKDFYSTPESKLELLPLGGNVITEDFYINQKKTLRNKFLFEDDITYYLISGKFDETKYTIELCESFIKSHDSKQVLILIGGISESIKEQLNYTISKDSNIHFLGWKNFEELKQYIMATDFYIQGPSASATLQVAMCLRSVVAFVNRDNEYKYIPKEAYFELNCDLQLNKLLAIKKDSLEYLTLRENSIHFAETILDYNKQALKIIEDCNLKLV